MIKMCGGGRVPRAAMPILVAPLAVPALRFWSLRFRCIWSFGSILGCEVWSLGSGVEGLRFEYRVGGWGLGASV